MLQTTMMAMTPMPSASHHKKRIGVLGGSFNPAHAGHVHISLEAKKRLGLDEIWWLVSPQNPLKSTRGMADFRTRFAKAVRITVHEPAIYISDFERYIESFYTVESLAQLVMHYPKAQFIWLMGADNLQHFHHWEQWRQIAGIMPFAVLDRAPYHRNALYSKAALALRKFRVSRAQLARYFRAGTTPPTPCWCYIPIPRNPLSGTQIRKTLGKNAYKE